MAYQPPQPPNVNGVMTLTPTQITSIKSALQSIQSAFVADANFTVCDTFYMVMKYNQQNPTTPINGDTAQYVLSQP